MHPLPFTVGDSLIIEGDRYSFTEINNKTTYAPAPEKPEKPREPLRPTAWERLNKDDPDPESP